MNAPIEGGGRAEIEAESGVERKSGLKWKRVVAQCAPRPFPSSNPFSTLLRLIP